MGKPTGFLEYLRELPSELAPLDRVHNWDEFHLPMEDDKLRTQAARCIDRQGQNWLVQMYCNKSGPIV